jgi:hypothetical protein
MNFKSQKKTDGKVDESCRIKTEYASIPIKAAK